MSKKILAVVLALIMVFSVMLPVTAATGNWGEISYQVIDGQVKITAITDASYNRLALFYADDTSLAACLETTNSYVEDGDNRVWTITVPVELAIPGEFDTELKSFVIRGRDAATNTYKAGGISDAFEVMPEYSITSYGYETRANKVVINVTAASYVNKVIVVSAATGEILGYDGTATPNEWSETGENDWTITFPYDENDTAYIIKARDERTGKYNKNDVWEIEADYAPVEPIINIDVADYDEENIIVRVETIAGLYRVKVAYADDAKGFIAYAKEAVATTENGEVWEFIIAKPEVETEYAIDIAYTEKAYEKYYSPIIYTPDIIPPAPEFFVENVANAITDGWYTTTDGLVQIYVGDWLYYGAYGLTLVAAYTAPVDAATIAVYEADKDEEFAAKTADDFAAVLGEAVTSFEAVTVAGEYAGFVAKTATYTNLVFQANGSKYFINYINADDGIAIDNVAARAFENIVVCKPAPDAATNANLVTDGWYTTADGLVQMYVSDWSYYGAYGLTLVKNPLAYPTSAATIAIYEADPEDVFAAKTAEDFAAVLQEEVTSFVGVTVAGQYPGFVAETATYRNLVFQANGYKYFINIINGADGTDVDAAITAIINSIIVYVPVVEECTHENTTTTTVDATCTAAGSITVTCDDCTEVISTEVIDATGHLNTTTTTVDPTCTVAGSITVTCDDCNETISTETIGAMGHTTTVTIVDATCGKDGLMTETCDDCGETVSEKVITATGEHAYTWEITSMPAIDVAGEKAYTCGGCDATYTETMAALTAPNAEAAANAVDNGWYTTTDGLVQLYVADWSYYGSYGLTLVKNPLAYPTSAITVAVYEADADDVFAAKTAEDFAAVLQEEVTSFEAVTVAGQYSGFIAYTATYRNLVFQANGYKYFINVIGAAGEEAICEELFQIMAANVVVYTPCTHANTTTTTVDATCGEAGSITVTCDDCLETISTEVIDETGEHAYTWEITSMPAIDVAGEKTYTCGVCGDAYTEAVAALTAPTSNEANTVAGTWYTTNDGLVQLYVADWMYYGSYGLTLVKSAAIPTSAATIAVYEADTDEEFAAKTKADFESVLQETISEFYAVTIAGQYPGYVAYTASYRNLVFQANGYKYFINIIGIETEQDACEELFQIMMANIIVNEPAVCEHANTSVVETVAGTYNTKGTGNVVCDDCTEVVEEGVETSYVAPAEELWNTVTADGWYVYADGKAAMNVGSWVYYGSYGITLVGAANVVPIDAATIAIYEADPDDVFAAKTAEDFAGVLQEDVTSFEAVTICGYPGYIAKTASYRNLVFQANGYKYFINYMVVDGDSANVDSEADFAIAVDSIIVY